MMSLCYHELDFDVRRLNEPSNGNLHYLTHLSKVVHRSGSCMDEQDNDLQCSGEFHCKLLTKFWERNSIVGR